MADVKEQIKKDYLSGITPKKLAEKYDTSLNTIKSWIKRYGWSEIKKRGALSNTQGAPSVASRKRKQGGQPGNKNAEGSGAPEQNKNAEKHGFFSKYLPEETLSIIQEMPKNPLDVLWDQIQIAYAAIIRAQKIMYVSDQNDKTKEMTLDGSEATGYDVQQAWDKQANFLSAQARAQKTLEGMINRYEDLLHKNWDLATEEQKARIAQLKANTERIQNGSNDDGEDGVTIVNDAPTGEDIRYSDPEVSADIQQQED